MEIAFILYLVLILSLLGVSIYGLILSFKSSILLGIVGLIFPVIPFIIGLYKILSKNNLAELLVKKLGGL